MTDDRQMQDYMLGQMGVGTGSVHNELGQQSRLTFGVNNTPIRPVSNTPVCPASLRRAAVASGPRRVRRPLRDEALWGWAVTLVAFIYLMVRPAFAAPQTYLNFAVPVVAGVVVWAFFRLLPGVFTVVQMLTKWLFLAALAAGAVYLAYRLFG